MANGSKTQTMTAQFKSWLARLTLIVTLVSVSALAPLPAAPVMAQAVPGIGAPIYVAGDVLQMVDVFDQTGARLERFDGNFSILNALAVGDVVNGDGVDEVVLAEDFNGLVVIFDTVGTPLGSFDTDFDGGDGFAAADVDGNGSDEIVMIGNVFGFVQIFDGAGTLLNSYDTDHDLFDASAVGDLFNADGIDELVSVRDSDGLVRAFDRFGNLVGSFDTDFDIGDSIAIGNLDPTVPGDELVVVGNFFGGVEVFDEFGNVLSSFDTDFDAGDGLAVGDVDGDGVDEIVMAGDVKQVARIFDQVGNLEGSFDADFSVSDALAIGRHGYPDQDHDGLLDSWEKFGLDVDNNGTIDIDLPAMGANFQHKDLFLELDVMVGPPPNAPADQFNTQPTRAEINLMKEAFKAAPIDAGGFLNPDGKPGINLWVDTGNLIDPTANEEGIIGNCFDGLDNGGDGLTDSADPDCSAGGIEDNVFGNCADGRDNGKDGLTDGADPDCLVGDNLGGGGVIPTTPFCGIDGIINNTFYATKQANFNSNRRLVFRYAVSGPGLPPNGCSFGGQGELGGNDFADHARNGATLMHELGHNLGLGHGGNQSNNCKPNYVSIMNYDNWAVSVISPTLFVPGTLLTAIGRPGILDYSPPRFALSGGGISRGTAPLADLVESSLNEQTILDPSDPSNMFTFVNGKGQKVQSPLNGDIDGDGPGDGNGNGIGDGVDWNGDGTLSGAIPPLNIDTSIISGTKTIPDPDCTNGSNNSTLTSFDDWSAISLPFRQFGESSDGPINLDDHQDPTLEEQLATLHVVNTTDLALTLSDTPDPVAAGTNLIYTADVQNHGPNPAAGTRLVDTLPAGVTFLSASGGSCSESPQGTLTCDLDYLAAHQSRQLQITVGVAADLVYQAGGPLSLTNAASVSHLAGPDSDASNNSATTSTQVVAVADLELTSAAQDAPAEVLIGQPTAVTIRAQINNHGPSAPMDVKLTSTASAAPGTTVTPATTERTEPALGLNELRPVDQSYTIACQQPGSHRFTFTSQIQPLHAEDSDPNPANNQSQVTVTVDCVIPVAINIKPGSLENPIDLNEGAIPVAVLTTKAGEYGLPLDFNATQINAATVRFGPRNFVFANQGGAAPVKNKGHLERSLELDEITKDADTDMVLQFPTAQTGLGPQDTEGCVKGRLNGAPGQDFKFFGCDHIHITPTGAALANPASRGGEAGPEAATPEVTTRLFLPLVTR